MTGEPLERKPWTSSWELPPIHTLAAKFRWSDAGCVDVARVCEVLIPKEGRGTRSGSADGGGFVRVAAAGRRGSAPVAVRPLRRAAPQHPVVPLTTLTLTVAVASAAEMFSSCTKLGEMVSVTWYVPRLSRKGLPKPSGSLPQPLATPHTEPSWNGLKLQANVYGDVAAASGVAFCGLKSFGQNVTVLVATTLPLEFVTLTCKNFRRPDQPASTVAGRGML